MTFSANGTNAAKSTVATFSKAGTYTLSATISDTYGQNVTSNVTVTVNQTLSTIVVSPTTSYLTNGQTQSFTPTALDQFNNPMAIVPTFTWSVDQGSIGTVDAAGTYTAPLSTAGSATVRATSGIISGTAAVTVNYLMGDMNFDGHRDAADIVAFMQAVTNLGTYQTQEGLSNQDLLAIADINGDNHVDNADLQALISLLANASGGASASVFSLTAPASSAGLAAEKGTANSQIVSSSSVESSPPFTAACETEFTDEFRVYASIHTQ